MALTKRSLPALVNLQARILEKQEAVQERKAKRKVPLSFLSCTLKHFNGSTVEIQARISEIQEALQETKAVQEMKEQVHSSFISCSQIHTHGYCEVGR